MKSEFLKKYNEVFNEDGTVKLCGREKCKNLIIACEVLSKNVTEGHFGNAVTGMMNIKNIQKFRNDIK